MSDDEPGWGDEDGGWPDVPEDGEDVELVNAFDEAEDIKKNQPKQALELFENVIMMEESKDEKKFTFKSLENIVVLSARLGDLDNMVSKQKSLLKQLSKQGKNDQTEAINNVLNAVSTYLQGNPEYQSQMYELTLGVLKGNDGRLWFGTCSRLAKILLESGQYEKMDSILTEMKDFCRSATDPAKFDQMKENLLLDAFALEIQMCTETKNIQRMKSVYPQTTKLNSVILDPRVMGVIKECGGKMFMGEKKWDNALEELFDSFKNYQEIGSFRAKTVLKYVILASILSGSKIDYMQTREAKVYCEDSQIISINLLRKSFENNDINQMQSVLSDKNAGILDDPFIFQYLEDLLRGIRLKVLVARVQPYKAVSLDFLASNLNVSRDEIRSLLSELILEERIKGEIDQISGFLEMRSTEGNGAQKHIAMRDWARSLISLQSQLIKKLPQ